MQIEEAEHVTNKVGKSFRVLDAFLSDLECDSELPAEDFDEDDLDAVELQLQVECNNSGVVVKNSPLHERGLFANKYLPKDTKFNYFGELQLMNKKQDGVRFAELDVTLPSHPGVIVCVNACRTCPASYANHVDSVTQPKYVNAKLVCNPLWRGSSQPRSQFNPTGNYVSALNLVLLRPVEDQEEICFDYGEEYWIDSSGNLIPFNKVLEDSDDGDELYDYTSNGELEWVMCENCRKWRTLPSSIKADTLPAQW